VGDAHPALEAVAPYSTSQRSQWARRFVNVNCARQSDRRQRRHRPRGHCRGQ